MSVVSQGEYAKAGVDYTKIAPFKRAMVAVGKKTLEFPFWSRNVRVRQCAHGAAFSYVGNYPDVMWCKTEEGLGNKNWIAEWMRKFSGTGRSYYEGIGIDTALMAVNDVIAQGALPAVYVDEVAAGDSEWFADEQRAHDLAQSFFAACQMCGMALPAGESPSLRYLIKAAEPVDSAPSLSGCVTGVIAPAKAIITGEKMGVGDRIIGVASSGIHANGISLVIRRAMKLRERFMTKLPNGHTLGDEALIPTRSYVELVEALLGAYINVHAFLPGTGSGLSKIAVDERPFQYRIHSWLPVPPLFLFMRELGVSLTDCLTTFNWGVGYYIFVPASDVSRALNVGRSMGYVMNEIGIVEMGKRCVIFEPENIVLPPPGD